MTGLQEPKKILFIAGAGRSGSTLLEIILGNMPGFFSVGELRSFWHHLQSGTLRCGCGKLPLECEFWGAVWPQMQATAGLDLNPGNLDRLSQSWNRTRRLPRLSTMSTELPESLELLRQGTLTLYNAVFQAIPGQIVIDASKAPSHLWLLEHCPDYEIHVLHLVRDARAVAYAWSHRRKRERAATFKTRMPCRSSATAALAWNAENVWAELIGKRAKAYTRVRYEDFTAEPQAILNAALDKLGLPSATPFDVMASEALALQTTHSIGGNPVRFDTGPIVIRQDEKWKTQLPAWQRVVVNIITAPLLRRYGYPIRTSTGDN